MSSCTFLPRHGAEDFHPEPNSHLISISDGPEDQALIDEARWKSVSYHYFVDAGFDEEVIEIYGPDFELHYRDYILASKADALRDRIRQLASQGDFIVVNCQAGRSRSAAVARYISEHHGYQLEKPTPDANLCVYRMLARDERLLSAYRAATAVQEPSRQASRFLTMLKSLFG